MSCMWLFRFRCKFAFFMLCFFRCKMFSESIFKYLFHGKIWLTVKYFLLSKKHSTKTCKTFHTKLLTYYDSKCIFLICKPKVVPSKLLWEFFCHSWFIFPTSCFSIRHINWLSCFRLETCLANGYQLLQFLEHLCATLVTC